MSWFLVILFLIVTFGTFSEANSHHHKKPTSAVVVGTEIQFYNSDMSDVMSVFNVNMTLIHRVNNLYVVRVCVGDSQADNF
ncbi:hypothetical protein TSUD_168570 [Trifolium subterraneum]|nr:hypothetical protein TSUD_168570 [Trifolium subterraneum]